MASEDKTNTYEETVTRTTSDPVTDETTAAEEGSITTVPSSNVETYEVQSVTTPEEESVSAKAKEAGRSLKDLIYSLGKKTKEVTEEKTKELKAQSVDISVTSDARDIQNLGDEAERLVTVFEDTMTEIRKEPYDEQEKLLVGYKRLLEEQINVIGARLDMAKRLKPGA
ncbi:MAG TPA: hypothetical protein VE199_05445 [Nitrososphaera sp.]|nr:hypothetical protein [Nitrososphaera sp.]